LKTPLDDLTAENSMLTTRNEELADEITKLKSESTKARELANAQRIQAKRKEKGMN
jgi:cell division protein FtsB